MDYGTGKSLCVLKYIEEHFDMAKDKVLIVAKKVNAISSWPEQIRLHTDFPYKILVGSFNDIWKGLNSVSFIYIINYDNLEKMLPYLLEKNFDMVVFDESTKIKNPEAYVTKAAHKLAKKIKKRAILTGFPITESLKEVWAQYFVVDYGAALEESYWKFRNKYFYKWRFGWSPKKGAKEIILSKLEHAVVMDISQCEGLPPKSRIFQPVIPSAIQIKYLSQLRNDFALSIKNTNIEFKHVLPVLVKMQQIASGFIYLTEGTERFYTPKLDILVDLLNSISAKKIIWCKFNEEVSMIMSKIGASNIICIKSTMDKKQIKKSIEKFKESRKVNTLVTTYDFLYSGENLTEASYSIHYGYHWSNDIMTNAERRVWRKGSEKHKRIIYIYIYLQNTIEEKMLTCVKKKKRTVEDLRRYMIEWARRKKI
jgi:SNF2 family DNA or RNA helicase